MTSIALPPPDQAMDALRRLNGRFIENFVTNNVAAHDAILHPGFTYLSGGGKRIGRADYLKAWARGFDPDVLPYWDLRDEAITLVGPVGLVRAVNRYLEQRGSALVEAMAAYTDTYLWSAGRWLCIQAQITPVARENWPGEDTILRVWRHGIEQPLG